MAVSGEGSAFSLAVGLILLRPSRSFPSNDWLAEGLDHCLGSPYCQLHEALHSSENTATAHNQMHWQCWRLNAELYYTHLITSSGVRTQGKKMSPLLVFTPLWSTCWNTRDTNLLLRSWYHIYLPLCTVINNTVFVVFPWISYSKYQKV
jgi:hypothetical protein